MFLLKKKKKQNKKEVSFSKGFNEFGLVALQLEAAVCGPLYINTTLRF